RMIRLPTPEAVARFLRELDTVDAPDDGDILGILRGCARRLLRSDIVGLPAHALDLSLPISLTCMYAWRMAGFAEMSLVHDRSSNMARHKPVWDGILSPTAPPAVVGYGSEKVTFPIGVVRTVFEDSKASDALQVADVIAGAFCRWSRWIIQGRPGGDAYGRQL